MNLSSKLAVTALMSFISLLFGHGLIQGFWEMVSLECKPQPSIAQINCHIHQEIYPGRVKNTYIAKTQLVETKIIEYSGSRSSMGRLQRVVLVTKDRKEIPLTRSFGGTANEQLYRSVDKIDRFIKNDRQHTLSIATSRSWLFWAIAGFVSIADFIILMAVWSSSSNRPNGADNFYDN